MKIKIQISELRSKQTTHENNFSEIKQNQVNKFIWSITRFANEEIKKLAAI